ncbi:MAG: hypothetical protein V4555_05705 [Acidobacteriota bacterium]
MESPAFIDCIASSTPALRLDGLRIEIHISHSQRMLLPKVLVQRARWASDTCGGSAKAEENAVGIGPLRKGGRRAQLISGYYSELSNLHHCPGAFVIHIIWLSGCRRRIA